MRQLFFNAYLENQNWSDLTRDLISFFIFDMEDSTPTQNDRKTYRSCRFNRQPRRFWYSSLR